MSKDPCACKTEFVVVVEIDNKRAAAAFANAKQESDAFWPDLVKACDYRDKWVARHYEKMREANEAKFREKHADYFAALDAYEKWDGTGFLGRALVRPARPVEPYEVMFRREYGDDGIGWRPAAGGLLDIYQSTLHKVKRMGNVASAATSPYKVTEVDADFMMCCESGAVWDEAKKTIDEHGIIQKED